MPKENIAWGSVSGRGLREGLPPQMECNHRKPLGLGVWGLVAEVSEVAFLGVGTFDSGPCRIAGPVNKSFGELLLLRILGAGVQSRLELVSAL